MPLKPCQSGKLRRSDMLPKSAAYVQLEKRLRITAFPEQVSLLNNMQKINAL